MGFIFLLIAGCLWGALGPMSRFAFAAGLTPLETAFWRGTIAGISFVAHFALVMFRKPSKWQSMDNPRNWDKGLFLTVCCFGILGVGVLEGSYVYAVHFGGAALASILLYSAPIWVNLFGWRILKETIRPKQWFALFMTFSGILGVSLWGAQINFSQIAILCGLLSGLGYALFYVAGKYFFKQCSPVSIFMVAFPVGSLTLLPLLYGVDNLSPLDILSRFNGFSEIAKWSLIGVGVFCTYLPYLFYAAGLKRVDAGRAAIVTTIEPVVAITLAHVFWNEQFSAAGYVFCILVLLGVMLVS